jgi:hypothetical protein
MRPGPVRASRRPSRALLGVAAAGLVALTPAAPAAADPAGSVTKASGSVEATLAWSAGEFGVRRPTLTISRGGVPASGPSRLFTQDCGSSDCVLAPSGRRSDALQLVDLDADGEPEVLVDGFTGGAHCCAVTDVEGWVGGQQQSYFARTLRWGNGGYDLRDLDGDRRLEFVSADDRFSDAYTSHAASATPVQVLRYVGAGRALRPVTRRYPAVVRRDLRAHRALLRRARRQHYDARGIVAAIVADLYLLHRPSDARATLAARTRSGELGGARAARAYRRALLRDLRRWGYG